MGDGECWSCGGTRARAGGVEVCEPSLQCAPKKRFVRAGVMRPRPVIVKPGSSVALDRLVEVALSSTNNCHAPLSSSKLSDGAGSGVGGEDSAMAPSEIELPLEAVRKLKRLSSFDKVPRPRSAPHGKKFTPRFKSLVDISC